MLVIDWIASLTPAERDALRTLGVLIGGAGVPVFGLILTWTARIIKRQTRQAVENTAISQWVDSHLKSISVAQIAHQIRGDTSGLKDEVRSEITDLVNDPRTGTGPVPRLHGRRRDPSRNTDAVVHSPRYRPPQSESHYQGTDHE